MNGKSNFIAMTTDYRRRKGQFYTPKRLTQVAWCRIIEKLGDNFWDDGTWRIWDNCTGSGNLEYEIIPPSALSYTYLSTINSTEVENLKHNGYFRNQCAGIFPYNWLNDDDSKLPKALRDDLRNEQLRWLFFINPPYAESGTGIGKDYKVGVKNSSVAAEMHAKKLGQSANELTAQFLYRIERDFGICGYYLGLFSTAKYITKPSQEKFRKCWFPVFDGGFMVNAGQHFDKQDDEEYELATTGKFPVLFSLLDRRRKAVTWHQDWTYDVLDGNLQCVGKKTFAVYDQQRLDFRDYFFPLDKADKHISLPIMSGAVIPCNGTSRQSGNVSADFVGSVKLVSIDCQGIGKCFLTSALPASHEVCITVHNYRRVLTGYALYRSVKPDWQRNADVFYAPCRDLTNVETADAMLYALLDNQNNTATTLVNGTLLHNWFNPFDTAKFDFRNCSDAGKHAFDELAKYCNNIVRWDELATPYGKGIWLGLYQYRTSFEQVNKTYKRKFGSDYPNDDLYGFSYPATFLAAIELLRKRVESCAAKLSFGSFDK